MIIRAHKVRQRYAAFRIFDLPLTVLLALLMAIGARPADAATDPALTAVQQFPSVTELRRQKEDQLQSLKQNKVSPSTLELANLELETARVALGALEVELKNLPINPALPLSDAEPKESLASDTDPHQEPLLDQATQLKQAIEKQRGRIDVLTRWLADLRNIAVRQQAEDTQSQWAEQKAKMVAQREGYSEQARALKEKLSALDGSGAIEKSQGLRINILEADERASLISLSVDIKSAELALESMHTRIQAMIEPRQPVLAELRREIDQQSLDLNALAPVVGKKLELLKMYRDSGSLLSNRQQEQIGTLVSDYELQQQKLIATKTAADSTSARISGLKALADKRLLSARYRWPGSWSEWGLVATEVRGGTLALITDAYALLKEVLNKPVSSLVKTLVLIIVSISVLTVARGVMISYLPELNRSETSYSRWMSALYMHMVQRNLYTLFVVATVPAAMWLLEIPFERYRPLYWILAVVMVTKPLLNLNHTLYTQRKIGLEWYDKQLFRGLHGSIILGAALVILTLIVRHSDVSSLTTETISRLLMLGLLVGSAVVLWRRGAILRTLSVALDTQPRIFFLLKAATLVFPVAGLATGFIGLLGYTNLAWHMSRYEGVILAVVTGWMSVRGFTIDFFRSWYTRSTRKMPNGWIYAQAVVRPLELLVRALLVLFAAGLVFRLLGLSGDASVTSRINDVLSTPLFHVGDSDITLLSVLVVLASSSVFFWAAKWSREFAYRWLYRHIHDHGIRNSLSVFTQYAVVLIGLFVLLKVLGIDLTALAVLAGAIGVGIGFGLQTIANNFISGILLLIERPFRTGDIINIGGNEGEVTRIGIRSLSVKTWDNTEVIIPNTDTMTAAFVNWTHQDNVIRVLDHIGVSYDANPHKVKVLIEEQIAKHPHVLKHPEPQVLLDTFADSSVNFRVQFFVDIATSSHLQVKSEVLFNIWDVFKKEGIEIPYPQQDLHLRSVASDVMGDLSRLDGRPSAPSVDSKKS